MENEHKINKKSSREAVIDAVRRHVVLENASVALRDDMGVVLAAASVGVNLKYASQRILNDRECVMALAKENGFVLKFANEKFRSDKEIAVAAVASNTSAIGFVSRDFGSDKEFVLSLLDSMLDKPQEVVVPFLYGPLSGFIHDSLKESCNWADLGWEDRIESLRNHVRAEKLNDSLSQSLAQNKKKIMRKERKV